LRWYDAKGNWVSSEAGVKQQQETKRLAQQQVGEAQQQVEQSSATS